jgi:spore maturation protein CgeB
MKIVILGLSITSSWGNGHATTYRGLTKALVERGHQVLFLERDAPWYAAHRDLHAAPRVAKLYSDLDELRSEYHDAVAGADLVMVGSYVPEGVKVGEWVIAHAGGITAFYDIDTPVTLAKLRRNDDEYLSKKLVYKYHLYLSFTGGPILRRLETEMGAGLVRPLYCSADPAAYFPSSAEYEWDLGYMGTYSLDRQRTLQRIFIEPAALWPDARMVAAGPQYPDSIKWPPNISRIAHLSPSEHRLFYCSQRFTLNVTRRAMAEAGFSPSVRLFEAAACETPIITDPWQGMEEFFHPGEEILVARNAQETLSYLRDMPERERREVGRRARERVLSAHTSLHRAEQLERYYSEAMSAQGARN